MESKLITILWVLAILALLAFIFGIITFYFFHKSIKYIDFLTIDAFEKEKNILLELNDLLKQRLKYLIIEMVFLIVQFILWVFTLKTPAFNDALIFSFIGAEFVYFVVTIISLVNLAKVAKYFKNSVILGYIFSSVFTFGFNLIFFTFQIFLTMLYKSTIPCLLFGVIYFILNVTSLILLLIISTKILHNKRVLMPRNINKNKKQKRVNC